MMVQSILLPVFVLVGFTFFLLLWTARARREAPARGDAVADLFGLPTLFYALVAIALQLHKADLAMVMLSWVFVVTQFVHAGILAGSGNGRSRSAWFAGVLVLFAMWVYFAFRQLFPVAISPI